jgi:hypothetical protein
MTRARDLTLVRAAPGDVRPYIALWHSRLPMTQSGPWKLGFLAFMGEVCFGAALWHNTSARGLPRDWLELRRLAIPDNAPMHTASWMLGAMRKWIGLNMPDVSRLVSYQDIAVHTGTIYKAAGWEPTYFTKARVRDRTPKRTGTNRAYRSDLNGGLVASSAKQRWEIDVYHPNNRVKKWAL